MPKDTKTYILFVAAPSDITIEKDIIRKLAVQWNRLQGEMMNVRIEVQDWESHSFPSYGKRPQELINEQVFDQCDFVIAIFWTRFGLPTGEAASGTEEEILRALKKEKPLALYFSDKPVNPSGINHEQYQKVLNFKHEHKDFNLYKTYNSDAAFEEKFRDDLSRIMISILNNDQINTVPLYKPKEKEEDETGAEYKQPEAIVKLIERTFKVYWAKLFGIIENDENILPNGIKITKANQNKQEVQALKQTVAEWDNRIAEYSTALQTTLASMNEYGSDEFKNDIFSEELWTVKGALTNPDHELDRYRDSFEKVESHLIVEIVSNIISTSNEYAKALPKPVKLAQMRSPEDFGFSVLLDPPTLLTGVIGKGIRSEIMHKLYPDLFTLMTRRSIWGLYFLTEESSEFVVDDHYKDVFRTVHNWDYLYDRFSYYNYVVYKQMAKYLSKHKIVLNEKYMYGYANLFLIAIGESHSDDIAKLRKPKRI